jgi:Protein of unknown function (DUF2846)
MKKVCLLGCVLVLCAMTVGAQDQTSTSNSSAPQASTSPAAPANTSAPEIARLRVYRARRYVGSALAPSIVVDGKQVARVGNGRRVTIKLAPGPHSIASDDKSSAISLEAKAGQDYYVRVDESTGFWKGHGKLTMLMPEQGSAEFKLQKPIEPDRKFAKEMIEEEDAETTPPDKTKS